MLWVVLQLVLQMSDMILVLIDIITAAFNYSSIVSLTICLNLENNSKICANLFLFFFFFFFFLPTFARTGEIPL